MLRFAHLKLISVEFPIAQIVCLFLNLPPHHHHSNDSMAAGSRTPSNIGNCQDRGKVHFWNNDKFFSFRKTQTQDN